MISAGPASGTTRSSRCGWRGRGSPGELIDRLFKIDATRAPLHPLLLQVWLRLFGTSEFAARSFSVLCGIATILLIYQIGRDAFDARTGVWAAWLAALSPILIVYSREARMYAWLVLVTCLCWRLLLALRRSFTMNKAAAYVCLPGRPGLFAPARSLDARRRLASPGFSICARPSAARSAGWPFTWR